METECLHANKIVTKQGSIVDPAWVIDWYCTDCGEKHTFDHKHEYETILNAATYDGKIFDRLQCTKCRHSVLASKPH